ncbi:c-type cytochrome [Ginsengibacter hankyongi]|uniref:C-type cytochrome n=1 Tax=Ginsengibacter hankyongi TaxID=2607284 RepID=A0A5J5IL10_9BACT|nr:c-type cytochrome [Ginsengibacter hankyongi]KAA9040757.1 c-type cytochrome [Ginsengibacter hankyongi]
MKKFLALLPLLILLAACGGNSNESTSSTTTDSSSTTQAAANDISSNPDYQKGLALVAKSNCLTCHKVEEKLIGPAYKDVANKYAGNDTAVTYLAHKVIAGGKGVWGQVAMTPHPDLSEADAEQMVKYILLLKQ